MRGATSWSAAVRARHRVGFNGGVTTIRIPPAVLFTAAAAAQHAVSRSRRPTAISTVLGLKVAAWSGVLMLASLREFRRERTTVDPVHVDGATALIAGGPFSRSRNPIYLGLAGVLIGHALTRRSWAALLPVAAFIGAVDRLQIPAEEAALERTFGEEYLAYAETVPRWVGARSLRLRRPSA